MQGRSAGAAKSCPWGQLLTPKHQRGSRAKGSERPTPKELRSANAADSPFSTAEASENVRATWLSNLTNEVFEVLALEVVALKLIVRSARGTQ